MIARLRRALRAQLIPLIAGFAVLALIVIARTFLIELQRHDNEAVRQAFEFERRVVSVLSLVQDVETGQRGYPLTGEASYLEPYKSALSALPRELEELKSTAVREFESGRPDRSSMTAVGDKLAEVAETLRLYDQRNATGAINLVRSDQGKIAMDRIRAIVADIPSVTRTRCCSSD